MPAKKEVDYEATVTLPSKGILYNNIPSDITLRGMTTKEEKILYASSGSNSFHKILSNCIIEPQGIDIKDLIAADELFLIIQLRMITYGPKYKVSAECPFCGRNEVYTIDLSEFEVDYLSEEFKEPIIVDLPRSKDQLGLRLLRNRDTEFVNKQSRKFAKQFNLNAKETEYTFRMAKYIDTINGEKVDFVSARQYVDEMASLDSAKFWTAINKVVVGIDSTCSVQCGCGEEFEFSMPMSSEFFRPEIE